jgi:outer membrane beta-barrel protein
MRPIAIAWLLVAVPVAGLAQQVPGIDLSQPPPPRKDEPQPRPGDEVLPPVDLGNSPPQKPRPPEPAAKPAVGREEPLSPLGPPGERDVALGDRVKAVQRKGFLKRHRLEATPYFATTLNDAFYTKFGGGLRLAYNVEDNLAVAVRGTWFTPYRSDFVREGKIAFQSQLLTSQPSYQAMLDLMWSPVYGKIAVMGRSIVHFDLYLMGGFGGVWSATSFAPRNEGPHIATDLGGGVRFYPLEWMALEAGLVATLYPDQPMLSVPGTVQKVFTVNVGASFFFPTAFEYMHP